MNDISAKRMFVGAGHARDMQANARRHCQDIAGAGMARSYHTSP